ncbi:uncharacterized protein DUF4245 [Brevibacterium sanguinis]|uniref:Uncharacterized protein DUF4245 n=3 Tax=Brevibacteriaceae TaxID=85019 RepID=A0A366ILS4_9MICO|nr:uncharacterized protein DUF4245 [Brevibacterium sanguinis]RBP72831.1 uncharacterized protein DUF4245 [Brevibacterium celere]
MRVLRKNSNWVNMMIAILACFAVVVGALLMAPQPEVETERVVDYQAIAQQAQGSADFDLIVPEIPPGWSSNEASLGQVGDSEHTSWYMSFIGAEQQWVSIEQAAASQKWAENQVGDAVPAETATVGGARFQVYRAEDGREHWVTSHDDMYVVLSATALPETVDGFAQQIADQLR